LHCGFLISIKIILLTEKRVQQCKPDVLPIISGDCGLHRDYILKTVDTQQHCFFLLNDFGHCSTGRNKCQAVKFGKSIKRIVVFVKIIKNLLKSLQLSCEKAVKTLKYNWTEGVRVLRA